MKWDEVKTTNKAGIKKRIRKEDTRKWKEELESKSSLNLYKRFKKEIKEERVYDNRFSARLLGRARANTLDLNDRKRFQRGDTSCGLCKAEKEDLRHFLLDCRELEYRRNQNLLEKAKGENEEETMGNLLFNMKGTDLEEVKGMLWKLWVAREARLPAGTTARN